MSFIDTKYYLGSTGNGIEAKRNEFEVKWRFKITLVGILRHLFIFLSTSIVTLTK